MNRQETYRKILDCFGNTMQCIVAKIGIDTFDTL